MSDPPVPITTTASTSSVVPATTYGLIPMEQEPTNSVAKQSTNGAAKNLSHALNADPSLMATMPPIPPQIITASDTVRPVSALTNNALLVNTGNKQQA